MTADFIKNISVTFSIHPSFNYTMMFWGNMQWHLTSKHGVYYGVQRVKFLSHLTRLVLFSQYFTGLSKCCAANCKWASTCFFFSKTALCGKRAYRPRRWSALLIVFFETVVHANSRSFWSSPQLVLGFWTTLLIIIFTPLSEICKEHLVVAGLWWNYVVSTSDPNSAHWSILTYRNP